MFAYSPRHRLNLDVSRLVNLNIRQTAVADTVRNRVEQLQNKIATYAMVTAMLLTPLAQRQQGHGEVGLEGHVQR